jgi:hypothetical protein
MEEEEEEEEEDPRRRSEPCSLFISYCATTI